MSTNYRDADLTSFQSSIATAREMWLNRALAYFKAHGDVGTCVLGAGIAVDYIPKGKRSPIAKIIISAGDISPAQGSCVWEESVQDVIAYLRSQGIECFYAPGFMD